MKKDKKLSTVSTFNGIGAFSEGAKLLGFGTNKRIICEYDPKTNKTYYQNNTRFKVNKHVNDIRDLVIKIKENYKTDLLIQTPPCQSFSMAGKRLGLDSENGNLFLTAIELQKKIDADVVLYENVKGLCSHEKYEYTYFDQDGNEVILRQKLKKNELKKLKLKFDFVYIDLYGSEIILEEKLKKKKLKELNFTLVEDNEKEDSFKPLIKSNYKNTIGLTLHTIEKLLLEDDRYDYQWQVINSTDVGLPQRRERIFIVGIKKEINKGFKFPTPKEDIDFTVADIMEDEVDESYYYNIKDEYEFVPKEQGRKIKEIHTAGRIKGVKFDQDARITWAYVAPTATTGNNMKFLLNDGRIRHLIGDELKAIHGFRKGFILGEGKPNKIERWVILYLPQFIKKF
jgi:DNA (cytosine-5)-methyltransferase 1